MQKLLWATIWHAWLTSSVSLVLFAVSTTWIIVKLIEDFKHNNLDSILVSIITLVLLLLILVTIMVYLMRQHRSSYRSHNVRPWKIYGQPQDPVETIQGLLSLCWGITLMFTLVISVLAYEIPILLLAIPGLFALVPLTRGLRTFSRLMRGIPITPD